MAPDFKRTRYWTQRLFSPYYFMQQMCLLATGGGGGFEVVLLFSVTAERDGLVAAERVGLKS